MKFIIRSQKVKVTDAINKYVEEKIGRLDKYFENPNDLTANILIRVRNNEQIIEATIPIKKFILRGEELNNNLYAAIDLLSDKLERQIRKNKTKMQSKKIKNNITQFNDFDVDEEENFNKIVKRKNLDTKPMTEEEAILQMELLGHSFFIFKNESNKNISVLYKRKDENYGIIDIK